MKYIFAIILSLFATSALAQSSRDQAVAQKLLSEINAGLQCNSDKIDMAAELEKAKARIKELEDGRK